MQAGVTSDASTARGLGLSINGQRPSSSNFLLDGLENNNYLITGPLSRIAPEAIQEYRISTSNFSAEYGRTSGFLANAVTRSGGSRWHCLGYFYVKNEALNANDFQRNLKGLGRSPERESQPGFSIGGPIRRGSLFASGSFEYLRNRGLQDPQSFIFPTPTFIQFTAPESAARHLLEQYRPPVVTDRNLFTATTAIAQPVSSDRYLALPRVDYIPAGAHRLMGRLSVVRVNRPEFIWTPYKDFVSPLNQSTTSLALTPVSTLGPNVVNEARFGVSADDLHWDRPHPEIPTLVSIDGAVLPGSPAFYAYRNHSRHFELVDNLLWARGRHILKFGAGFLLRRLDGFLTAGRDAEFIFGNVVDFALAQPVFLAAAALRQNLPQLTTPNYDREYRYNQFSFFAQDTFKITPRLVLNFGARYENSGAPLNTGPVKDAVISLGSGASLPERLAGARLDFPSSGDQQLYAADNNDWAARFGFSYSLRSDARTLLRGGYGIFYDRPFDNLWQSLRGNGIALFFDFPLFVQTDFLAPVSKFLAGYRNTRASRDFGFPPPALYQPGLRSSYVHSYFFGVQHRATENLTLEVNALGSLGRKLITTDLINRPFSVVVPTERFFDNPLGRFNPNLPDISYRANQGLSDYNALTAVARYRGHRAQAQLAYTWSHTIDNQSEPLAGDFFDLRFTSFNASRDRDAVSDAVSLGSRLATFPRQFDSRSSRGSSDFDQRHSLVFFSVWDLPALAAGRKAAPLLRNWQLSELAAIRSGFPYSVTANPVSFTSSAPLLYSNRADLVDPTRARTDTAAPGGRRLLDRSAFRGAGAGLLGSSGRSAFRGPGFFSIDLSLGRSFHLPWLGEAGRLVFRADAFNVLNHANLDRPDSFLDSETFGRALFGRKGRSVGFPTVTPFDETARQVQLLFRLEF